MVYMIGLSALLTYPSQTHDDMTLQSSATITVTNTTTTTTTTTTWHDARVDSTRALTVVELVRVAGRHVANADGIDDVDRKERRPAQQKHRYKRTHVQQTVIFHFNYNI